ncbi:IS4-like element IS421 family transposase [soil metagenome]
MAEDPNAMNEDWELLKSLFPAGWEDLAHARGATKGLRKNKAAGDLLRTLLMHVGCGYSLRETAVRARQADLAQISDVALLKRLRKSKDWLHALCAGLFAERDWDAPAACAESFYLLDASSVREPGKTGSQWRLHYSVRWPSLRCDSFKVTPGEGGGTGESFVQFPVVAGGHYLADRGYSSARGIRHVAERGGRLAVRLNPNAVRLCSEDGGLFPLLERLRELDRPGRVSQWPVTVVDRRGKEAAHGRLCAVRKSEEATRQAAAKLRRKAQKNGTNLQPETLEYSRFVLVFTTFEEGRFPPWKVLEWYRVRWQVELVFKRFKSIAELGHLPKHDPESSEAWLYGKLFVALLTEKLMAQAMAFSPWGYSIGGQPQPEPLA